MLFRCVPARCWGRTGSETFCRDRNPAINYRKKKVFSSDIGSRTGKFCESYSNIWTFPSSGQVTRATFWSSLWSVSPMQPPGCTWWGLMLWAGIFVITGGWKHLSVWFMHFSSLLYNTIKLQFPHYERDFTAFLGEDTKLWGYLFFFPLREFL